jgi:hypothetical protein
MLQYIMNTVFTKLFGMSKRTAEGSDPIPYWFLKHCAEELTPIITHIRFI